MGPSSSSVKYGDVTTVTKVRRQPKKRHRSVAGECQPETNRGPRDVCGRIMAILVANNLVGGWATPLNNMSSSIGMIRHPSHMGK